MERREHLCQCVSCGFIGLNWLLLNGIAAFLAKRPRIIHQVRILPILVPFSPHPLYHRPVRPDAAPLTSYTFL